MSYDADAPSVYSCEIRKARKDHKCCECHQVIKAGEKYQLFKGCWEGSWGRFKTCIPCADLRDEMAQADPDREAPPFEELGDLAREYDYDFPPKAHDLQREGI